MKTRISKKTDNQRDKKIEKWGKWKRLEEGDVQAAKKEEGNSEEAKREKEGNSEEVKKVTGKKEEQLRSDKRIKGRKRETQERGLVRNVKRYKDCTIWGTGAK